MDRPLYITTQQSLCLHVALHGPEQSYYYILAQDSVVSFNPHCAVARISQCHREMTYVTEMLIKVICYSVSKGPC